MMLIPSGASDIGPRRGLVTLVALLDLCFGLAGDLLGDHAKVHHVVAGGGLVALRAVHRSGGRVAELGDRPGRRRVAGCAVGAEQFKVPVIVLVTCGTVKNHFLCGEVRVRPGRLGGAIAQIVLEPTHRYLIFAIGVWIVCELLQTDSR